MVRISAFSSGASLGFMAMPQLLLMAWHLQQLCRGVTAGAAMGATHPSAPATLPGTGGKEPPLPQPIPVLNAARLRVLPL